VSLVKPIVKSGSRGVQKNYFVIFGHSYKFLQILKVRTIFCELKQLKKDLKSPHSVRPKVGPWLQCTARRPATHGLPKGRLGHGLTAWSSVTEPPQKWGVCLPRSYWGILDEARMRKHTHKHIVPNMKFNLKLLQIKCHVLGFTTDKAQKVLQRIIRVFVKVFVSHDRHTLFALEESEPPRTTYTCESQ
jgi:hypothetical protein